MNRTPKLYTVALLSAAASLAHAQSVRTEKNISLELATQIASAAVADCQAKGYTVSATVVDRAGSVRAVLRADNAGPHTLQSSERKAWTSASMKVATQVLMDSSLKSPAAGYLVHLPGVVLLGGGVPVKVGNDTIGAVGVGGAPSGQIDEQCAMAGIDKVKDHLN